MCTRSARSSVLLLFGAACAIAQTAAPPTNTTLSIYEDVRAGKTESGADVHVLKRDQGSAEEAQAEGRWYTANESLGDPTGFGLYFTNNLGLYEIGDRAPLGSNGTMTVVVPRSAYVMLIKDSSVVTEGETARLTFPVKAPGRYRAVVSVAQGAGRREWIRTQPLTIVSEAAAATVPEARPAAAFERTGDIGYAGSDPKQTLDIYRPKAAEKAPVLLFVHGGYWRGGDRAQYARLGQRFASDGIVTVVISYRLQPTHPHPAQIEDVAAAFAWALKNIEKYGGDPAKLFVMGHSAGGHLVSLLATNPEFLAKHGLTNKTIKGVIPISGVPDVRSLPQYFGADAAVRTQASPIVHARRDVPPFLHLWAQWDFATLPAQARQFHAALEKAGADSKIMEAPGANHVSILVNIATKAEDPAARAILKMVR